MNKFNGQKQIEETTEFKDSEVMNELNNEIQVGDKVQWWGFKGDEQILLAGRVESVGEFNSVKTFNVRKFGMLPAVTMITASRVTKIGK
tara:strand:- start:3055 stop:3321 length:267 start_codon:yes stop_codon:yes gene_type:complete